MDIVHDFDTFKDEFKEKNYATSNTLQFAVPTLIKSKSQFMIQNYLKSTRQYYNHNWRQYIEEHFFRNYDQLSFLVDEDLFDDHFILDSLRNCDRQLFFFLLVTLYFLRVV